MQFRYLLIIVSTFCLTLLWVVWEEVPNKQVGGYTREVGDELEGPGQFRDFHQSIRTPEDLSGPQYKLGFRMRELEQARSYAHRQRSSSRTQSNGVLEWVERGPANVPGRTRAIVVDPDDATKKTWYAGSAGGGVWKTITGGNNWTLLTPDLTNLATTVLAMAQSNHNILYLGTGESFGGLPGIAGNGMFKSTDRGESWSYLVTTNTFSDINRIVIDPDNENIVVAATSNGIFRTVTGGTTWSQVSGRTFIEDLRATPNDFNIQYATQNGVGVIKSTNAGATWTLSNEGMNPSGRIEIAISPVNTNRIFASAQGSLSGSQSDLYVSDDAGATWSVVNVAINNTTVDFLGGQGWYDNTIMCDPFNADLVYYGGVGIFRSQLESGSTAVNSYTLVEQNTTFLSLVNFNASFAGGRLEVGTANANVEVRFGAGKNQKAHRFLVPVGATSGVPDVSYNYADYVEVPFEVWDVTNNKQLMVSFRDQDRNGQFNLLLQNTTGEATTHSREYIYISNVEYNASNPAAGIATNGGHIFQQMYFFWPVLAAGKTWPDDIISSNLKINFTSVPKRNATTITVADPYNAFDGKNKFITFGVDVHPDQHNLLAVPMSATTYKIINASDGGIVVSNISSTPGINSGDWTVVGRTYNTGQFYGVDKRPGFNEYFGGLQDNGTWKTPAGTQSSNATNFQFSFGGDGFEVVWHKLDDKKLIGGSQNNNFRKSSDGGITWSVATSGLTGTHPFVSKLANSQDNPEVLFTLSSAGVFRSTDFGSNWILTPITEKWGTSSLMDIEVSRANANIVWAGSGMANSGTLRNLHVSTNGGITFIPTNNYTDRVLGGITKLASHPTEPNTAFSLFSFAGRPKILRTRNLGNTWEDISGFGMNSSSATGFPDVAVYCLFVRPDNPDIIWVGTEIGIVESLDNGMTWALLDDFPNVSVWDMKGQDDQVVIATHGRGIWSATIDAELSTLKNPIITGIGTSPQSALALGITLENFDSTLVFISGVKIGKIGSTSAGNYVIKITGVSKGTVQAKLISYKSSAPFHSETVSGQHLQLNTYQNQYFNYFKPTAVADFFLDSFTIQDFGSANTSLQTFHNYPLNSNLIAFLKQPIIVTEEHPFFFYRDVAIVEPGNAGSLFGQSQFKDYVVVEGTKDGVTWIPLADGYDASLNPSWLNTYNSMQAGLSNQFVDHDINLKSKFAVGDTLLFRFRLFSDNTVASWGWTVDDLYIQQVPTGVESSKNISAWSMYPNPTRGTVTLTYTLTQKTAVEILILDPTGKMVDQKSFGVREIGVHEENLTMPSQAGTYLIQLQTQSGRKVLKIIKN
ncbi:MAG: T9SS type A sorting domain-containing protein [Cyclobacteriaceae bacterium]|nr:T9SS type A sorting domain-containing protein [Cyclobacteriaceae bacterium]